MEFVDTHTHLDDDAFSDDLDSVLAESRARGVTRWINVGYNERRWESTTALVDGTEGMSCMLGLHPGNASEWSDRLFERLRDVVQLAAPVAIGEIGIDLYWRQDTLDIQRVALRAQLELARERKLPAVIHMRNADVELLEVLEIAPALPRLHFHSFDGDAKLRAWIVAHGATIGVGGLITRNGTESLRAWVRSLPRDRVTLETDAPYLKPRGIRGTRNEPAYLVKTAKLLSELWGVDIETVADLTTRNAERIFSLPEGSIQ
jgi:TatD DNase family protein